MIAELTKEQWAKVPVYLKKWLDIGYDTSRLDRERAKKAVTWAYEFTNNRPPEVFIFLDSPMACQLAANLIKNTKWDEPSQLDSQLRSQLHRQLDNKLGRHLGSQLYSHLDSQLRSQLRSQLDSQELKYYDGIDLKWWWSDYYCFYDFILNEIFPERKSEFKLLDYVHEYLKSVNHVVAFKDIVFISESPVAIHKDEQGRLHNEEGLALEYADGWGINSLSGVRVNETIIKLIKEKKEPEKVLSISNIEQRLVAIRAFGIGNMREQLNSTTLDRSEMYELYEIDFMGGREKILRMKNPSEEKWHDEFVPPHTKDIKDALRIRWGLNKYVEPLFRC